MEKGTKQLCPTYFSKQRTGILSGSGNSFYTKAYQVVLPVCSPKLRWSFCESSTMCLASCEYFINKIQLINLGTIENHMHKQTKLIFTRSNRTAKMIRSRRI
jgi:hypothetical protein